MEEPTAYWLVRVFDSATQISELRVPANRIAHRRGGIALLLQTLVAKHALDDEEIAHALLYKRYRSKHLEVRSSNFPSLAFECGGNVHAVAVLTDAYGEPIRTPVVE